MREKRNLWCLTEEKPKQEVLQTIFELFAKDRGLGFFASEIRIVPLINEQNEFEFTYEVLGFNCTAVDKVFIKTISGASSFVDYLVFYQNDEPSCSCEPIYAIEQTKTDDSESRNTGVYQRCSKFVFLEHYYPTAKKIMLYTLQVKQKADPTQTYIFGTRLLLTLGVIIKGKKLDKDIFTPFTSVDEIITFKSLMRSAPKGNVPIIITKCNDNKLQISARLLKADSLSHDPNIGALSLICSAIRKLGYSGEIEITSHSLEQRHLSNKSNKFLLIADLLDVKLFDLQMPDNLRYPSEYWHYETEGEKLATIFIHLVVESFTNGFSIFDNHAGCEKSYFCTSQTEYIPLAKYTNREEYKAGDKDKIIFIPDLVLIDNSGKIIVDIEGKKYQFMHKGIEELKDYKAFDELYNRKYYPQFNVTHSVVLYGSQSQSVSEPEVGFLLNREGKMILGVRAPEIFSRAIKNLLDYWQSSK